VADGICINLPTVTTTTDRTDTQTTVTRRNNATGQVISQETTNGSSSRGVVSSQGTSPSEQKKSGPCDPTQKNYQECVGLLLSVSDGEKASLTGQIDEAANAANQSSLDKTVAAIRDTSGGVGVDLSPMRRALDPIFLPSPDCSPYVVQFGPYASYNIECDAFNRFREWLSWAMFIFTHLVIVEIFLRKA
jgi:soluble cytochrome b562